MMETTTQKMKQPEYSEKQCLCLFARVQLHMGGIMCVVTQYVCIIIG